MLEPCEFLPWDSEFFGLRIARVNAHTSTDRAMQEVLGWCQAQAIDCLYFLANSDDPQTVAAAEQHGFHLVDIRMTLEYRSGPHAPAQEASTVHILPYCDDHLAGLQVIAAASYTDTRFYSDPCFSRTVASSLYETWIRNSANGFADQILVALPAYGEATGNAVGFITCRLPIGNTSEAAGEIGLLGVGADARRSGAATALVSAAIEWFANRQVSTIRVVTQGRNIAAQRLYQKCGFRTQTVQLWYHKWFKDCVSRS